MNIETQNNQIIWLQEVVKILKEAHEEFKADLDKLDEKEKNHVE